MSIENGTRRPMFQFERKISIDGVAVITASIALIVWLTTLSNQTKQNTADIASNREWLKQLTAAQTQTAQGVAVLTAIEQQRQMTAPK